jgi:hypothetical protein
VKTLHIKHFVFMSLLMMFGCSLPAVAGLFGPSNYEECVLENMKGIQSNTAAGAVMQACRKKFPQKIESNTAGGNPRIDLWDGGYGPMLLNKVDLISRNGNSVTVTNKNTFALAGIYVGITSSKPNSCPTAKEDYKEIYYCNGSILSNTTGRVDCSNAPSNKTICLVGLLGEYQSDVQGFFMRIGVK